MASGSFCSLGVHYTYDFSIKVSKTLILSTKMRFIEDITIFTTILFLTPRIKQKNNLTNHPRFLTSEYPVGSSLWRHCLVSCSGPFSVFFSSHANASTSSSTFYLRNIWKMSVLSGGKWHRMFYYSFASQCHAIKNVKWKGCVK